MQPDEDCAGQSKSVAYYNIQIDQFPANQNTNWTDGQTGSASAPSSFSSPHNP